MRPSAAPKRVLANEPAATLRLATAQIGPSHSIGTPASRA